MNCNFQSQPLKNTCISWNTKSITSDLNPKSSHEPVRNRKKYTHNSRLCKGDACKEDFHFKLYPSSAPLFYYLFRR